MSARLYAGKAPQPRLSDIPVMGKRAEGEETGKTFVLVVLVGFLALGPWLGRSNRLVLVFRFLEGVADEP